MSWSVAALVAPLMSGVVIDRWGAEWLWGLCAVIGTVAGVGYWALMLRMPGSEAEVEVEFEVDAEAQAAARGPAAETPSLAGPRPGPSPDADADADVRTTP